MTNFSDQLKELVSDGNLDDLFSTELCSLVAECFSGNKAVIIRSGDNSAPSVLSFGACNQSISAYEQHFYRLDPMDQFRSANSALRMSDAVSKKWFESSEFYNDFFKPMDSYHSLSLKRRISGKNGIEIAINRGSSSSDFDNDDKRRLKTTTALLTARIGVLEARKKLLKCYRTEKLEQLSTLTERELELFIHVSAGMSLNAFKDQNNISVHTARALLKSLRAKLHTESQLELTKVAQAIA